VNLKRKVKNGGEKEQQKTDVSEGHVTAKWGNEDGGYNFAAAPVKRTPEKRGRKDEQGKRQVRHEPVNLGGNKQRRKNAFVLVWESKNDGGRKST